MTVVGTRKAASGIAREVLALVRDVLASPTRARNLASWALDGRAIAARLRWLRDRLRDGGLGTPSSPPPGDPAALERLRSFLWGVRGGLWGAVGDPEDFARSLRLDIDRALEPTAAQILRSEGDSGIAALGVYVTAGWGVPDALEEVQACSDLRALELLLRVLRSEDDGRVDRKYLIDLVWLRITVLCPHEAALTALNQGAPICARCGIVLGGQGENLVTSTSASPAALVHSGSEGDDGPLNPQQQAAVDHGEGPLVVLAGAGTGKTRVLTRRLVRLVRSGVPPWEILAVTFTNKAAAEMSARLVQLLGDQARTAWVGTFHATCARLLRRYGGYVGLRPGFLIYDEADQTRMVERLVRDLGIHEHASARGVLARIGRAKDRGADPAAPTGHPLDDACARVWSPYQDRLRVENAVDFADLLLRALDLPGHRAGGLPAACQVYPRPGRRVPGHEPGPVRGGPATLGEDPEPDGGRRRRPGDLRVARGGAGQPAPLRERLPRRVRRQAGGELPVHAARPGRRERRDRPQRGQARQDALDEAIGAVTRWRFTRPTTTAGRRPSSRPRSSACSRHAASSPRTSRSSTAPTSSRA